ncbi:hypothetical protein niasHT_009402 [Heterodera trifolii]|uniref:Uncharacterized protein n=1 Tax=Heterodera trifolii TaxID=157864 RepID=A0ABD2M1M8_9BILA
MFEEENVVQHQNKATRNRTCEICGGASSFKYYNVFTCEACKQFFRRTILAQKIFDCPNGGNCDLLADAHKCRACRMNKCLSVGMDAQMVKKSAGVVVTQQFLDRLKKHKLSLLLSAGRQQNEHEEEEADDEQQSAPVFVPKEGCVVQKTGNNLTPKMFGGWAKKRQQAIGSAGNWQFDGQIRSQELIGVDTWPLEKRSLISSCKTAETHVTVRELELNQAKYDAAFYARGERDSRVGIVMRFGTPRELLGWHRSIFSDQHKYTAPPCGVREQILLNIIHMDLFELLHIFQSVPAFMLLDLDDQVHLFNYIAIILGSMCSKFRSMMANSEIEVKLPSNIVPLRELQRYPAYNNDLVAQKMARHLFVNMMEPFSRTRLSLDEFLLLRAILICHPGAPNLSRPAQKLLQSESERYARILLHFLQLKHGCFAGASRYAEIMQVVESMLHSQSKHFAYLGHLADVMLEAPKE